jgi:hypothetical protein
MSILHLGYGLLNSPHIIGRFMYNYGWSWFTPTISFTKNQEIELQSQEKKKQDDSTALIPYVPITIKMPTAYDVSAKIITTVIVEVPVFVIKNLYNSPIPTAVALYTILPTEVWMIVGPRILYFLPKLL